jgi:hypothetical protein
MSIGAGLATAGVVFAIYSQATPSMADIRVARPNDEQIQATNKTALWMSIAVVSGVSLIAKDSNIFIMGGAMALVMFWWTEHGNMVNPLTNDISQEGAQQVEVAPAADEADAGLSEAAGF